MRYIPELSASGVILQVPEGQNSHINVLNAGATGRGDLEFQGTVFSSTETELIVSNVNDGNSSTLFQYLDLFSRDIDVKLFVYKTAGSIQDPLITILNTTAQGVNFSNSTGINSNLAPLKYYVWGFNTVTGRLPNYVAEVTIGTKVLNPDLWNSEQYVQINFSRSSQYTLPIIYRTWGDRVELLGIIGNNKVGYGTNVTSFRDLGLTEIPSWDVDKVLPPYLSDIFNIVGVDINQTRSVQGSNLLTVVPDNNSNVLRFSGANLPIYSANDQVKFYIDDTKYVRNAIGLAARGRVKEVFFPSGVYNVRDSSFVNSTDVDYSGITLRGAGEGSVIKRIPVSLPNPINPGLLNFSGPSLAGVKICSLQLDGNRSGSFSVLSPADTESTLSVNVADNLGINDCTVLESGGKAINLTRINNLSFTGNKVINTGRSYEQASSPLTVNFGESLVVQGNIFQYATSGPKIISTDFSTVNGNIIRGCGNSGLELQASFQWNAQGNVAYSDNDSIIQSVDTYNNEYSRAAIEVRKGFALDPIYMTVTYGGESVSILKGSVKAEIYALTANGSKGSKIGSFRALETSDQLSAGIFALTLPALTSETYAGETIPATSTLNNASGYVYEVKSSVLIGNGTRGYRPSNIRSFNGPYAAIQLFNSSDILSLQIYSAGSLENDKILIKGFSNTSDLTGWDENVGYQVVDIDTDTNSIVINPPVGLTLPPTPISFVGGNLYILRSNYFVADGNLLVHSF